MFLWLVFLFRGILILRFGDGYFNPQKVEDEYSHAPETDNSLPLPHSSRWSRVEAD